MPDPMSPVPDLKPKVWLSLRGGKLAGSPTMG